MLVGKNEDEDSNIDSENTNIEKVHNSLEERLKRRNSINDNESNENLVDYNDVFLDPEKVKLKKKAIENSNKSEEYERDKLFKQFKLEVDKAITMSEILNIIKKFSMTSSIKSADDSETATNVNENFVLPEDFNPYICEKIHKMQMNKTMVQKNNIIDNKLETEVLSFLSRDIQSRSDQFLKNTKTDKIADILDSIVTLTEPYELKNAVLSDVRMNLDFSELRKKKIMETCNLQRVINPIALAKVFSKKIVNPIPHPINFNLRMSLSAYIDTTLLKEKTNTERKSRKPLKEEEIVDREKFNVTTMSGSDRQEKRKQALYNKIVAKCKKAKVAAIPFLFVTIAPGNFSQSVQNTFDVIQLFSDGVLSIRYTTDESFIKRVYEAHGYEIISTQLLDKMYICPKDLVGTSLIYETEFLPIEWKSLTSILSLTADICDTIASNFNIQSPFQLNEWVEELAIK